MMNSHRSSRMVYLLDEALRISSASVQSIVKK
jgi:hypothetical protein